MQLFGCASQLSILALHAVGKYVSGLLVQLVATSLHPDVRHIRMHYVLDACSKLREVISGVPSSLANELTIRLLEFVDLTYKDLKESKLYSGLDEVVEMVVGAILHPSTTRLENCRENPAAHFEYSFVYLYPIIFKILIQLNSLKVLKLGRLGAEMKWFVFNIGENLEEFSCMGCSDNVLRALSKSCNKLKCLNIKYPYITSDAVQSILKFRKLELLNIEHSQITEDDVTKILEGLALTDLNDKGNITKSSHILRNFGCSGLTSTHIRLLVEHFPNLTCLSLSNCRASNLDTLECLKYLTNLSLASIPLFKAKDLLQRIGKQLVSLSIDKVCGTDLHYIYDNCPSLQYFRLIFDDSPMGLGIPGGLSVLEYLKRLRLHDIRSLSFLEISVNDPKLLYYIVFRNINLRKLYVLNNNNLNVEILLKHNVHKHLEEYYRQETGLRYTRAKVFEHYVYLKTFNFRNGKEDVSRYTCPLNHIIK
ncbi:uncharacterized protein [Periplaneta americana]|uniref:uncharacterized protein n=1 Tax=Periplaneta americana TaxID=6978 RepID=UPI0037E86863